jgi:hypothetical protein
MRVEIRKISKWLVTHAKAFGLYTSENARLSNSSKKTIDTVMVLFYFLRLSCFRVENKLGV